MITQLEKLNYRIGDVVELGGKIFVITNFVQNLGYIEKMPTLMIYCSLELVGNNDVN